MEQSKPIDAHPCAWRKRMFEIIFEAETPAGKIFDVLLLWTILGSVLVVLLESVSSFRLEYGELLRKLEWFFTVLFTVEYVFRWICVRHPLRYAFSFFGIVDFLAIVPTYLSLVMTGAQSLIVIRALRLLRVFRVLKLGRFLGEIDVLMKALKASKDKILIFLFVVVTLTVIMGTVMYLVEGEEHGFTSIPKSIYWAIVTMTTVGYGDIAPQTVPGQFLASIIMILGYAIIVVPTGIFSVELSAATRNKADQRQCPHCEAKGHALDAIFCRYCGDKL